MLADALLIIDMQNAVCFAAGKIYHYDQLISLINQRINQYHQSNKPIIFVQHNDKHFIKPS
ncbi:MAG: isochorismatase family protein [Pasteurellaceae bacterium]|nr:isochorismatase family protein [Pasteurellaceae bacterium]